MFWGRHWFRHTVSTQICPCQSSFISSMYQPHLTLIYILVAQTWTWSTTANQLLDCLWHCQWKWLVCEAQTMKTSLFNKKALVKAFGFDATLNGGHSQTRRQCLTLTSQSFRLSTHRRSHRTLRHQSHGMLRRHMWRRLWPAYIKTETDYGSFL